MKRYTLAMKRKLVAEYATGDFPRKEFLSKHQIPNRVVARSGIEPLTHGFSVRTLYRILLLSITLG